MQSSQLPIQPTYYYVRCRRVEITEFVDVDDCDRVSPVVVSEAHILVVDLEELAVEPDPRRQVTILGGQVGFGPVPGIRLDQGAIHKKLIDQALGQYQTVDFRVHCRLNPISV